MGACHSCSCQPVGVSLPSCLLLPHTYTHTDIKSHDADLVCSYAAKAWVSQAATTSLECAQDVIRQAHLTALNQQVTTQLVYFAICMPKIYAQVPFLYRQDNQTRQSNIAHMHAETAYASQHEWLLTSMLAAV